MGIYTDRRKVKKTPDGYDLMIHESGHLEYDFDWHLGPYWSKFLAELRDNARFMGIKCSQCGTVYCPPRAGCGRCFAEMNEWVEVGPEGELRGFTVVRFPYINPNNGELMPVPYTAIWVTLDGAHTRTMHYCNEHDEKKLEVGMRMRAVFADEPRPTSIHAVKYFEVINPVRKAKPAARAKKAKPAKKAVKKPSKKTKATKK
ncbi:MAG: OB-fold domain-containing protein [Actinomycetota bacterium]|nr:OB-fold domain-containing protein [Actinomycetota bacterium]